MIEQAASPEAPTALPNEAALLEAILFLEGEPVDEKKLIRMTGLTQNLVRKALDLLILRHEKEDHGLEIVALAEGWTLAPKKVFWENLKKHYGRKQEEKLSRAALETLSIIAYSQPLTRMEVENIRGVNAEATIRFLKERNLIQNLGRKESPGRPVLLGTTKDFLKVFGLKSIANLPKMDEVSEKKFALNGKV